jgi:NADPH2 dehydrogenase
VHAKGGYIFSQLGALGRTADPKLVTVYGPSDDIYKDGGSDVEVKAFSDADIDRYVELFRQAALNAIEAGFDGIEIHGANGFVSYSAWKSDVRVGY